MKPPHAVRLLLLLTLVVWTVPSPPARAEEGARADEEKDTGREMVWDGYLFRDAEGRIRVGWPVVAMGVMAMPAHVVEGEITPRLAPLLTDVDDDYVFWNYELERRGDAALDGIPRALVRLQGPVTLERPNDPQAGSYQGGTRTMRDARLLSIELLPEAWLRTWGGIFRDRDSPFRIDLDRGTIQEEELRGFARRGLSLLLAMRAVPGIGEAERRLTASIERRAKLVETHRRQSEWALQRWLVDMKAKHPDLDLGGLASLPPPPPTALDLQRLLLEKETRAAFLAGVREVFPGDLDLLELPCYRQEGASTTWERVPVSDVERRWSDEEYRERRRLAVRMVGR